MTRTHEERLRTEMTVAQEVWRGDAPVARIGENQNPADFRDQQHTAAWAEARFLVAGKEADEAAVRIASELATEGRGMSGRDAKQLAEAITVVHGTEGTPAREDRTFATNIGRALAAAGPDVAPALDGSYIDYVVGSTAIGSPGTAARLDEIAATSDRRNVGFAVAGAPGLGLGSTRSEDGDVKWQIIDAHTGEIADRIDHANASSALASVRRIAGMGIVYEGIDAREQEDRWLKSMELPGEKVRIDTEARIPGVDVHDTMDQLGMDPLTISKSIVRTQMEPDHMGGERQATHLEYEFEGKEGRHPARQFMEEGGREHMYGVLLVRDERLWAVPLAEDEVLRDGVMLVDGPAREVVGFAGKDKDELHPEGFAALKETVLEENGAAGEYYMQPRDGFGDPGPINILNSPWSSSASMEELALAQTAVTKAIAKETREREDPVGVLVDAMRDTSKVWRLERERVDFTGRHGAEFHAAPPEADEKTALGLARAEANYLMRGRDANSAHVRTAAAMVATEGRAVSNNTGDLNATNLADSLSPGVAGSRKGVLAQAAASLSRGAAAPARGPAEQQATIAHVATRLGGQSR